MPQRVNYLSAGSKPVRVVNTGHSLCAFSADSSHQDAGADDGVDGCATLHGDACDCVRTARAGIGARNDKGPEALAPGPYLTPTIAESILCEEAPQHVVEPVSLIHEQSVSGALENLYTCIGHALGQGRCLALEPGRDRVKQRAATCAGSSTTRLCSAFVLSQHLDAFLRPRPFRLCFTPIALMGFALQRLPLPVKLPRLSARLTLTRNPFVRSAVVSRTTGADPLLGCQPSRVLSLPASTRPTPGLLPCASPAACRNRLREGASEYQ